MYSTRIFSQLTFIVGIAIVCIGVYLKINNQVSEGRTYLGRASFRTGPYDQTINGIGTILFGTIILFVSLVAYLVYLNQKKKIFELRKKEDSEENYV